MTWQVTLQLGDDHDVVNVAEEVTYEHVGYSIHSLTLLDIMQKCIWKKCSRILGEALVLGYVLSKSAHSSGLLCGCVSLSQSHPTEPCLNS